VVLGAVNSALINELHGGWPWWAGAAPATVAGAVLAFRLTSDSGPVRVTPGVAPGGVAAGRDIAGKVRTRPSRRSGAGKPGIVGSGAVFAGRDITESAVVDTTAGDDERPGR
jgi:hypothetical protein